MGKDQYFLPQHFFICHILLCKNTEPEILLRLHLHLHLFLNRKGCWGTTDDFTTSFLRKLGVLQQGGNSQSAHWCFYLGIVLICCKLLASELNLKWPASSLLQSTCWRSEDVWLQTLSTLHCAVYEKINFCFHRVFLVIVTDSFQYFLLNWFFSPSEKEHHW